MSDKMYTTCSNCGRRTHIAGCVSKTCQLDNLRRLLNRAMAEVNSIRLKIERLEKMPDEPEEVVTTQ